ncbi:DDE-type integrase/transposase/recombinase [Streptomyces sp. NWU49]|uniref:DDE-type integrase/transposase/recombinase n=1 Tax=Streptomyces sp. NWU49 TaxID=2201153 RepID=UPI00215AE14F|nr:DDE-type integrase/transposase/recombinase [Streptomyces sp. NWU49]
MGIVSPSYKPSCKRHRYPVEVISHCVWPSFRFPLGFREMGGLRRGVIVSCETVRRWCAEFGQACANGLRGRRPRPGGTGHLDEVSVKINGELKYPGRAVDAGGTVLDLFVQNRWDKAAARRFLRRLMKKPRAVPSAIVTGKLRSYGAAHRQVMSSVERRSRGGPKNRAENGRQSTRQRERAVKGFGPVGAAQRFPALSGISPHVRPRRHLVTAADCRTETTVRFVIWDQIAGSANLPMTA